MGVSRSGRTPTGGGRMHDRSGPRGPRAWDPRVYQISVLAGLLVYGILALDFELTWARAGLLIGTALLTQYVAGRLSGLPAFEPRSALISGLSLCLLLRT